MTPMRIVQITIDEALVSEVDTLAEKLGTTRSAFTREALRRAITARKTTEQEKRHREGYRKKPVGKSEFSNWEKEQVWPD